VLNNYAYFLSLEEKDLPRAITMAHRANELSPNNATYLDTYAWVLYQSGQYTQAKIYIDQTLAAIKEGEESSTYYRHAGDIYWSIGDRKSARKFWKRAEELEKENL
jgi:tetratricopeptide (TPR) repeat protein